MAILPFVQLAAAALLFVLVAYFAARFLFPMLPANIPRVRDEGRSRFSLRTRWAYLTDCRPLYREAYEKYSKHGKTCILPFLGLGESAILPGQSLKWLGNASDSVFNPYAAFIEIDHADYVAASAEHLSNPWQGSIVRSQMNRVLERLAGAIEDELKVAFDTRFGKDTENWKEIPLHNTLRMIIAQASSRFTVGKPLCRNEAYLEDQIQWGELYLRNAGALGMTPEFLKPVIARMLCFPQRLIEWRTRRALAPTFDERMAHLNDPDYKEPEDHFQMMLRYAEKSSPTELNTRALGGRLNLANFGSMHQSSYMSTNLVFDLVAYNREHNTFAVLREELDHVLAEQNNVWNRATVAKLVKMDSTMRESQRMSSFTNRNVVRKVVAKEGVTTEDGVHLPHGSIVSVLSEPAQSDPSNFVNPGKQDPFRFAKLREEILSKTEGTADATALGGLSFVSLSNSHLVFGYGKHACPGRFLLDFEIKLLVAYLVRNYDVELCGGKDVERPDSPWLCEATFPPMKAMVRIKRRKGTV